MPPQPGVFPVNGSKPPRAHKEDDLNKDKKRKDLAGRLGQEMSERRDEQSLASARIYNEPIQLFQRHAMQLATRPDTSNTYNLCLYPLSLERSALLGQLMVEERHSLETVEATYQAEQALVEKEYKQGRARIRDRLMEGIEERRKRAREERDSDNTMGDSNMDSSSRGHPTRKLRNKFGGSPPPNILPYPPAANPSAISSLPTVIPPITNPLSLAVDELPSPFPLPLTSTINTGPTYVNGPNGKRKAKGGAKDVPVLGKALEKMTSAKEAEIDDDLRNIQDNHKGRRRPAVSAYAARTKVR